MNFHAQFHECVDDLIILNKTQRLQLDLNIYNSLPFPAYLEEFCTVRVSAGRQLGKTQFIIRNATGDDLICVPSVIMRMRMMGAVAPGVVDIVTPRFFDEDHLRLSPRHNPMYTIKNYRKYDTIFVDEAGLFFRNVTKPSFYNALSHFCFKSTTIVMFG